MNVTDRAKLAKAGFRLYRSDKFNKCIKRQTGPQSWKIVGRYPTIKALEDAATEFSKSERVVFI